jgi:hypothetical protein
MLVNFARGLQTVHKGHGEVEYGNVRTMLERQIDGSLAIFRFKKFSARLREELTEGPPDGGIIVCNENSHGQLSRRVDASQAEGVMPYGLTHELPQRRNTAEPVSGKGFGRVSYRSIPMLAFRQGASKDCYECKCRGPTRFPQGNKRRISQ